MGDDRRALITKTRPVLHGQAVIAGTRVPVSVVLDCRATGMNAEQIVAEYPTLTAGGVHAAAPLRSAAGPRGAGTADTPRVKAKLNENVPRSAGRALVAAGHDVDTVADEDLAGAPDPRVVAAAATHRSADDDPGSRAR